MQNVRPPTGPQCPECKQQMRRRRLWRRWDRTSCKCGVRAELISLRPEIWNFFHNRGSER